MNYSHKLKIYFKLFELFIIVIAIFLVENNKNSFIRAANAHTKRKKLDRVWRAKRRDCITSEECKLIHPEENDNCINKCTSIQCFDKIYGDEPLEPGEVDFHRWRLFTTCARKEVQVLKKKQREESYKKRNNL